MLLHHGEPNEPTCTSGVWSLAIEANVQDRLGSGGGMSIEDALILSTLLGQTKSTPDALEALKVYGPQRRPRTQHVVKASHEQGVMWSGRGEEIGLKASKLEKEFARGWDFIHYFNVEAHRNEALQNLHDNLRRQGASDSKTQEN